MGPKRGFPKAVAAVLVLAAAAATGLSLAASGASSDPPARPAAAQRPNVVVVLTDDLAWNLVQYMPHVRQLQRRGSTFSRYFVTDSLCCPSRSSIFTGRFPHDTGIFTNMGADGGFQAFLNKGWESNTYATALAPLGYRTGFGGKYLNGYLPRTRHVPPGWTDWRTAGNAYGEFNYNLNENGALVHYGTTPGDYLTDVLATKGSAFINQAAAANKPFVLELATFAPHAPYTPAPRDANKFPGLRAPRPPSFNRANVNPPPWLRGHPRLTPQQVAGIDAAFRKRAQSVQAVDALIGKIEATLRARGLAQNTYIVFSSDNGYHMGEHLLNPGKMTAFDSDVRVPLIVAGPGVPAGRTISRIAANVDLYPTLVQLAGGTPSPSVDGRSLVPLLHGQRVPRWRTAALIEHHGPDQNGGDPDHPAAGSGNPTSYEAIRTPNAVYVEYRGRAREYYRIDRDPFERVNVFSRLSRRDRASLHATLTALANCHGAASCWAAANPR
jgi:N-acetylglucosamine-6-sulfatase